MNLLKKFFWILAIGGAWQLLYSLGGYSELIFPAPLQVLDYLWNGFKEGILFRAIGITLKRLLLGYGIGVFMGIPIGMLCNRFVFCEATIGKFALGLQTLPSICWVPLSLLWFGQSENAILFVVLMGSLWALILSTDKGIQQIPTIYTKAAKTMGSRGIYLWLTVVLPASLPFLVTGLKQSWAFAWRSLMAAEIYVSVLSELGLGQLLHYGREMQAMEQVVGIIFIVVGIGLMAERVLFLPIETELHKRWGTGKNTQSGYRV